METLLSRRYGILHFKRDRVKKFSFFELLNAGWSQRQERPNRYCNGKKLIFILRNGLSWAAHEKNKIA